MWSISVEVSRLGFAPDDVITIYESMNTVQIASSGRAPEAAKAYLVGYRNRRGSFSILAYLHFAQSMSRELYIPDESDFDLDGYSLTEDEGVQFLESMGFMMNNLNYRMLTQEHKAELQKELPFFWADLSAFARFRESLIQKAKGDHEVQEVSYKKPPEPAPTKERSISGVFRAAADKPGSGLIRPGGALTAEDEAARESDKAKLARLLSSF